MPRFTRPLGHRARSRRVSVSAEVLHAFASALTGHEKHITIDDPGSGRLNARALPRRATYVPGALRPASARTVLPGVAAEGKQ